MTVPIGYWMLSCKRHYRFGPCIHNCAAYHSMFVTKYLDGVFGAAVPLMGHCNAGKLTCRQQGFLDPWKMWLDLVGN